MSKYPKVGERVAFSYHGKARVGTVEDKTRKYMTLEHFDSLGVSFPESSLASAGGDFKRIFLYCK